MSTYVPWFLQEDTNLLTQEDGHLLLLDGEIVTTPDPPIPGIQIVWDKVEDREYQSGLDRGVLYLEDGSAVPWNGLTSINEKTNSDTKAVYWDGQKINSLVIAGDFEATLKAVTYPDEFSELEGIVQANPGMFLGNQKPKSFGLSYRTRIGSSVNENLGYKLHILYNVIAVPTDTEFATFTDSPSITEFEWDISAVPEEVVGFRPTAHIIIDSTSLDPNLLTLIEGLLYGTSTSDPTLIPMSEMIVYLLSWFNVLIFDNGDGTWTAYSSQPSGSNPITFPSSGQFAINPVYGTTINSTTYELHNAP